VTGESPIEQLLQALDGLDVEAVIARMASDARLLTADGHRAEGTLAIREVLVAFQAGIRSMTHRITAQWHQDDAWIAEVEADYELQDRLQLKSWPRAFIVRQGPDGITELNVYGAHERPVSEHRTGDAGMWIGERWIPPL
jgi:hypothetical protein